MKLHKKIIWKRRLAAMAIIACLGGCNRGIPILSEYQDQEETKNYSIPEMMLVVANERNRYEQVYTEQVWDLTIDEEGTTYKRYLLREIKRFLEEMATISLLAKENRITLTDQENEALRQLSAAYYDTLNEADRAYIQAGQDEIYHIYHEYHLANRVVEELTKDIDLEISDSEAKVISIAEIRVNSRITAQEVLGKLRNEEADFDSIAKNYSEDVFRTVQIGRGERGGSYDDVAFSLKTGEISRIIETDQGIYILKCVSDYEPDATQERKERLSLQRQSRAFRNIYNQFAGEHQVIFADDIFDSLIFSPGQGTTTTDFFKMYQDYMKN